MDQFKERVIGGLTFQVTPFPAFPALKLAGRLAKLLGPAFARMMPKLKESRPLDTDVEAILPAIQYLLDTLEPQDFAALCLDLLACTRVRGKEAIELNSETAFNAVFSAANLGTVAKVLAFVLETNGFFGLGGIGSHLAAFAAKVASPSGS